MNTGNPPAPLDSAACYAAFRARDARFDGRFFVGVRSTGIYCRPVCRVKMPKAENCTYFPSAAAAEGAGFRPCLKCRPELAPDLSPSDAPSQLARKAVLLMEENRLAEGTIAGLAVALGISDRHLRRAFSTEYGVSPVRYLQTRRLLLAKNLLADSGVSITEAAFAAGFGSLRRFNELFKKRYKRTPGELRRNGTCVVRNEAAGNEGGITLGLGFRPPYAWDALLSFLAARAIPGVESVAGGAYRRTVGLRQGEITYRGWVSVTRAPGKNALAVTLAPALLPVLPKVLARVRHLFDVNCDPLAVYEKLASMNEATPGLCVPGTRLPGCFDPFEMAVRAILGQQVTVKAARTLATRFAAALGGPLATPFAGLCRVFPFPEDIRALVPPVEDHLGPLGIPGARARSILALAGALGTGRITLSQSADPEKEVQTLLTLPGFGPWTAQYVALRALGWPDAFPHTDYGVKKALPGMTPEEILQLSQTWRPWRSYATICLWNSLSPHIPLLK